MKGDFAPEKCSVVQKVLEHNSSRNLGQNVLNNDAIMKRCPSITYFFIPLQLSISAVAAAGGTAALPLLLRVRPRREAVGGAGGQRGRGQAQRPRRHLLRPLRARRRFSGRGRFAVMFC